MSLFGDLFKTKEDTFTNFEWIQLESMEQLNEIINNSTKKTQVIFKHSTRCGVSGMIIRQFENRHEDKEHIDFNYLDLIRFRDISNTITSKFKITHQSPQLIVIKNKKVIAHNSHHGLLSIKLD